MIRRTVGLALMVCALLLLTAGWAQSRPALPPIMPLDEIKPGMRGVGRTVVKGQQIEEFTIEVIGILRGGGGSIPVRHLILFRASGSVIDRIGGTAAGMSGSPLYIKGKLIGALSAGYTFQPEKRDLALATPIEEMLRVLDLPEGGAGGLWSRMFVADRPLRVGDQRVTRIVIVPDRAQAERVDAARLPETTAFIPAAFPAVISGLSPRAARIIQQTLGLNGARQSSGGELAAFAARPITAGSSVGILQVRGDVSFGGLCSVTLRAGNKLLICGHPWENVGAVEYALTSSNIVTVVRTLERPFKEGNLGEVIGTIDQDRGPAIRGVLGRLPRKFVTRVAVTDLDTGQRVEQGMQVVRRRDLAKVFTAAMALTAIERARDQTLGGGTASVRLMLRGRGLPRPVIRENRFYNSRDIALAALLDLPEALNFLFYNDLAAVDPLDLSIEIGLTRKRQTAAIADVAVEQREVRAGERLRMRLTLRPFQETSQSSRVVEIAIPANYPRGPAVLIVRSAGPDIPMDVGLEQRLNQLLAEEPSPSPVDDLKDAIELFEGFGLNTQVLIQVVPFGLPADGAEFVKFDTFAGALLETEWIIQGSVRIPILIR